MFHEHEINMILGSDSDGHKIDKLTVWLAWCLPLTESDLGVHHLRFAPLQPSDHEMDHHILLCLPRLAGHHDGRRSSPLLAAAYHPSQAVAWHHPAGTSV
jgi:hypothetical protein